MHTVRVSYIYRPMSASCANKLHYSLHVYVCRISLEKADTLTPAKGVDT